MNKDFIPSYLENGYELKKQCRIDITSCVNYTYYIVHNKQTRDLLLLQDTHACLATTLPEAEIIHLEDIYSALYFEINSIEKRQSENYTTHEYKDSYLNEKHFEECKEYGIKWHQQHVDILQEFITTYLDL